MEHEHYGHRDPENDSISMHELDPSPVDEDPVVLSIDSLPSSSDVDTKRSTDTLTRSSTLGLSGHSAVYYRIFSSFLSSLSPPIPSNFSTLDLTFISLVTRIQKYSSYTFTLFLGMHITNNALIPLFTRSVSASEPYLLLTRPYYQSPLAEPIVVALPLLAHVSSGIALRVYRRVLLARRYGADSSLERQRLAWPRLSGTSLLGYILLPLAAGHIFVNRLLPLWVEGGNSGIGLSYVSHGFAKDPGISFVGYTLLIGVASWHFAWGMAKWWGYTPDSSTPFRQASAMDRAWWRKRRWYILNAISVGLAGVWMAGGLGVVGRGGLATGWVGRGYDELYKTIPLIGRWL